MSNKYDLVVLDYNLVYNLTKEGVKMLYPSIDSLLKKVSSKYLLVNLVSKRAKEMEKTEHYQIKESEYKSAKDIGKALEEINEGLIHIKDN